MMEQFEVIYEDAHILVVYKPAGVPTQTARIGQQDMVSLLKNYRMKKGEKPYIGLIHRLDQPVEGILVFAKDEKSAAKLSSQVQKHTMKKKYYGLVEGCPLEEEAILENRMAFDKRNNSSYLIVEKGEAVPTAYYPVLIVEDELGNSLIMGMKIEVSLDPRNLPMEFSGSFDCKTQSVIMKITDYGIQNSRKTQITKRRF